MPCWSDNIKLGKKHNFHRLKEYSDVSIEINCFRICGICGELIGYGEYDRHYYEEHIDWIEAIWLTRKPEYNSRKTRKIKVLKGFKIKSVDYGTGIVTFEKKEEEKYDRWNNQHKIQ